MDHPVETLDINVKGTEVVLRLANRFKKKVFIASTSEIYGKHVEHHLSENDNRVMGAVKKRRWAYACSKTLDEFLALAYFDEKKLPVLIGRLFNTVGPRQTGQYGMVLPNFVQSALLGRPITVFGDGTQTRSFTHVSDVVKAITALMNEPAAEGEISIEETSLRENYEVVGVSGGHIEVPCRSDENLRTAFKNVPHPLVSIVSSINQPAISRA
jgi:UDP-glucose 4-epimerase